MKLLFFVPLLFSFLNSTAQSFKKIPISESGCSMYSYCSIPRFDESKSPDSSRIFMGECSQDELFYGVICVKLQEPIPELPVAEEVLQTYLDYLQTSFRIQSAAGYGKGHRLKGSESTRGIIDYWKDEQQRNWKIKGWTNGYYLAVMYVYGKKDIPESKANLFLDGFRFPE